MKMKINKLRGVALATAMFAAGTLAATDYFAAEYVVIDISQGAEATSYPVSTLTDVPSGGWTDEYKTTKIVLHKCPKGEDPLKRYTLSKDFHAGVFEITQKQWLLVMGTAASTSGSDGEDFGTGETYPVFNVSFNMIRGANLGKTWPQSADVDAMSFLGKLRQKTGLTTLDLPTEAQWEYACRAGATTKYYNGDTTTDLKKAAWYTSNSGDVSHPVGGKDANAWGLYDTLGNVWEWCLDFSRGQLEGQDPTGPESGKDRVYRGGSFYNFAEYATCARNKQNYFFDVSSEDGEIGFRLFMQPAAEPFPELAAGAGAAEVSGALSGAADAALATNITTPEEYAAFRSWALGLEGVEASAVKASSTAWLSYALGQSALLEAAPTALAVAAVAPSAGGCEIDVEVGGVTVGAGATGANLAKAFGVVGAETLNGEFTSANVTVQTVSAADGKVRIRFVPVNAAAASFFVRAVMR